MSVHQMAAEVFISKIIEQIKHRQRRYIISIAGESGCGKTETGRALVDAFNKKNIPALCLEQDNYFFLPPLENDAMRKKDDAWLGPRKEVNLKLFNDNLKDAIEGASYIDVPNIDYDTNKKSIVKTDLTDIKVIIAEGTYTTLLKHIDTRIFIDGDYKDTLKYRKLRNRGNEIHDPFVENILETEHKIISGHFFLADFIITKEYEVIQVN